MTLKDSIETISQAMRPELQALSDFIYDHPELGHQEFESSKAHVDLLEKHGFQVEYPYLSFETAFRATYDSGKPGPTVSYLSEYDALPGIGHGCGHNMLGTVTTGAGIVLSKVIDDIGGRVVVLGTPAEETDGVKVDMAAADTFDDIDVALCAHPSDTNLMSNFSLAMHAIEFEFFGKTAHAAAAPWEGANALDGVIHLFNMIASLRQHIHPTARIHGVIADGGVAANVIPDYAKAQFYVRDEDINYVEVLKQKMITIAEAAALGTGTTMKWGHYEKSYGNMLTNPVLNNLYNQNASDYGIEMVAPKPGSFSGSIDMGNVSQVCPAIHSYYDITDGVETAGHTVEFREATKTEFGYQAMIRTVAILASTGFDVISQPETLAAIKEAYAEQTQVK